MDTSKDVVYSFPPQSQQNSSTTSRKSSGPLPKSDDVPIPARFAPSVAVTPVALYRLASPRIFRLRKAAMAKQD